MQADWPVETMARLALVAGTAVVIRSGLAVMGVDPVEKCADHRIDPGDGAQQRVGAGVRRSQHSQPHLSYPSAVPRNGPGNQTPGADCRRSWGHFAGRGWGMVGDWPSLAAWCRWCRRDSRPIQVKPDNPGGMQVAGANGDILSGDPDTNSGKLAPAPGRRGPRPYVILRRRLLRRPLSRHPRRLRLRRGFCGWKAGAGEIRCCGCQGLLALPDKTAVAADKHAATAAAAPASDHGAPVAKAALVQLAAVSSEAAAKEEWQRLQKRMPDLLDHRQPAISKIDRGGRTLCACARRLHRRRRRAGVLQHMRAKGPGCSVADF